MPTEAPGGPPFPRSESLVARIHALRNILKPTPIARLQMPGIELYAKLEYFNPVGSLKDRTAYWILRRAAERGDLRADSTIIESSSGNFASAVATLSQLAGLEFIPVIDPNIAGIYESFLRRVCRRVVKVEERDDTGGFLKTRLKRVAELCREIPNSYWTDQYGNEDGMRAHYELTGGEIVEAMDELTHVFIGVSTAGTISGLSRRLKERWPNIKIIAVDAVGSVIFGGQPQKRHIPGIGASVAPALLRHAIIDDVVMVREKETAEACQELLERHGVFAGGSSGTCYAAIKKYADRMRMHPSARALFLCADRGTAYLDTLYDRKWVERLE